jgi:hypothetical protein
VSLRAFLLLFAITTGLLLTVLVLHIELLAQEPAPMVTDVQLETR